MSASWFLSSFSSPSRPLQGLSFPIPVIFLLSPQSRESSLRTETVFYQSRVLSLSMATVDKGWLNGVCDEWGALTAPSPDRPLKVRSLLKFPAIKGQLCARHRARCFYTHPSSPSASPPTSPQDGSIFSCQVASLLLNFCCPLPVR